MEGQTSAALALPIPTDYTNGGDQTSNCPKDGRKKKKKATKGTDRSNGNRGDETEEEDQEKGINLAAAVAAMGASRSTDHLAVDERQSGGGRDRGMTDDSVCSTFEIGENSDSSRGSGYYIQLANGAIASSSSYANSGYASQSSTTSLPVLNLQHLKNCTGSNTSYLNNHHSHHLPHLPLRELKHNLSSSTNSLHGSAGDHVPPVTSSPPPHLLSFFLASSGSVSPTSSSSSTMSLSSPNGTLPMLSIIDAQAAASVGTHHPSRAKPSGGGNTAVDNQSHEGTGGARVVTLEELKGMPLSEVLPQEESGNRRLRLQAGLPEQEMERQDSKEQKKREKEMKKLASKGKGKGKDKNKGSFLGPYTSVKKKAESEGEDREGKKDRDRTPFVGNRKRASSTKSRKADDKEHASYSRSLLSSSSSAVETRRRSTTSKTPTRAKDEKGKSKKKEEKEKEKEKARKERDRRERKEDHHQAADAKQRRRPKYSLALPFRSKSMSSSSLPKMKNPDTIIPKSSPLALMLPTPLPGYDSAEPSTGFITATTASVSSSPSSVASLGSSASWVSTTCSGAAGHKKSALSSSNSGTKTRRPFIFSYGPASQSSVIYEHSPRGDHVATQGFEVLSSNSDTDSQEEKDTETVTSRFFRRNRNRTDSDNKRKERKEKEKEKEREKEKKKGRQAKREKTKKEKEKENKDHIRQGKEDRPGGGGKSPSRRRRSQSRRFQYSGSEDSESPEDKTECSLSRTKSSRSQLSSSGGSTSCRLGLSDSSNNMETDKIDRLAKTEAVNEILKIELARLHEEKQKLELERLLWESQQRVATQLITPNKQIKLNIGGEVFFTSIETLRKYPHCALSAIFTSPIFCSLPPEQQDKGCFIDRDPKHFRLILNFLRTGAMVWPESAGDRRELMLECEYYNLAEYVSLLPRKEFCRSVAKIFGNPLECDQDFRKITFHFDSSCLFLLTIQLSPYFPDDCPVLHVQSLSHCDEESKPIELTYSHFLAVGTSKTDTLAERLHAFVLSQLSHIKRSFVDKSTGLPSEDEFDSLTSEDSRWHSTASTEQLAL